MSRHTRIILRVNSDKPIGKSPDIENKNIFVELSRLSEKINDQEAEEFQMDSAAIIKISQKVSSLRLKPQGDVVIHFFNDVPDYVQCI